MKKIDVILSCDTKNEIDDQFAITYSVKSPNINLLGVVSVQNTKKHGVGSVDVYHREARKILRLCDSKILAHKGSRNPLKSENKPERSSGVEFIINTILKSKKKIYVISTGPCTDIVNACLIEPKIMKKCKFVWLGGFKSNEEVKNLKVNECNYNADIFATKILMELDIDLTLLPAWGVADKMITHCPSLIKSLENRNIPITKYLSKLLQSTGERFWILWDITAPAIIENPSLSNRKLIPSCKIVNGKFYFPKKNKHKITLVSDINESEIQKIARKYILK